jgi:hypothetical protein
VSSLLLQSIADCQRASTSRKHAAGTAHIVLRVLLASWRAREAGQVASVSERTSVEPESSSLSGSKDAAPGGGTLHQGTVAPATLICGQDGRTRTRSGRGGPQPEGQTMTAAPGFYLQPDALEAFLSDTQLFSSALLSQGTQFLDWTTNLDPTPELELQQLSQSNDLAQ